MKASPQKQGQPQEKVPLQGSRVVQHLIAHEAVTMSPHASTAGSKPESEALVTAPFGHDFSRIPVHSKSHKGLQAKLAANTLGDILEQEADRVAAQVTSGHGPQSQRAWDCGGSSCFSCQNGQVTHQHLQTKQVQANDSREIVAAPVVQEVLGASGQPLEPSSRTFMESRFGYDFSKVRVHTDAQAAQAAQAVKARAYTIGHEIVFGSGEYAPATLEGQRLLAHELTHVVQQRAVGMWTTPRTHEVRLDKGPEAEADAMGARVVSLDGRGQSAPLVSGHLSEVSPDILQRSAVASWTDATDAERVYFLSDSDRKNYLKQQEKLRENKTVKAPIALPQVEKIMNLSANYHHYDKYPTPEGGLLEFDRAIIGDVQKEFRIGTAPDFWPKIKWKAKDGLVHDIGVRFKISFIAHALEPTASNWENYAGMSMQSDKDVKTRPQENVILMRDIDNLSKLNLNASQIVAFAREIGLKNFVYDDTTNTVTYTPSTGGAAASYQALVDILTIIKLVREEARAQHVEEKLKNNTLGYASGSTVTFDTNKSAPASKTYNAYEPMEGITDYKDYERKALTKKKTDVFSPAKQRKRLAAVITHEIGHNIGMGHTDFGIMTESTEKDTFVHQATNLPDPFASSGVTINYSARIWEVSLETQDQAMTPENVQLLVNRMRTMTDYALPLLPVNEGAEKQPLEGFSQTPIAELKPLLKAGDYAAIFANDLYVALLAIPYQQTLLEELVTEDRITSKDREIIRNGMTAEGHLTYAGWLQLSAKARDYIKTETTRMIDKSFSGVSFFSSQLERDAY